MTIKRGDRVAVVTHAGYSYEGEFIALNSERQTFTLSNVIVFGSGTRSARGGPRSGRLIDECVEFKASDVQDLKALGSPDADLESRYQPAPRRNDYSESRTYSGNPNFGRRERSYSNSGGDRPFVPNRYNRKSWMGSTYQRDGSFPQRNPGTQEKNTLEEFDFEKAIEEFSQLKMNDSVEEPEADQKTPEPTPEKEELTEEEQNFYDKNKSFFDNLSEGAPRVPRAPQQPRYQNPNVVTFGLDTVKQLNDYRHHPSEQRYNRQRIPNFRRRTMGSYVPRNNQNVSRTPEWLNL